VSQVPRRATIACKNTLDAGIETIERHRMSLAACELGSPTHVLVNATVFTNNAG
jgi:hypothetical protein